MNTYTLVCGMEIHAELNTNSKMFCGCKNDPFNAQQPNIYTCPVCLGMPGGLPVANKQAVEWTIQLGLALNCKINLFSHFDRKHYFYPDLPKGYQISQYDQPFCYDGYLETEQGRVRIRRIHLEEDTAKLVHKTVDGKKVSLIDFNRSSVPLVEIVTEPDLISPEHAKAYAKEIRQLVRYLGIAHCDMEQGGMRLEANISMRPTSETALPGYKVEVKNINSFRFLENAIGYEMKRQSDLLSKHEVPAQETRGWNEAKGQTISQRTKEDAEDYRYFPDPDLPPLHFTQKHIDELHAAMPELPAARRLRWQTTYELDENTCAILLESRELADWTDELIKAAVAAELSPKAVINLVVNKKISTPLLTPVKEVIAAAHAATQHDTIDDTELQSFIAETISENPDAVQKFKSGKTQVLGFFVGQVMRKAGKKIDSAQLAQLVAEALNKV